ncbi:hypothetical protein [Dactylosporangium sp. NPDC051484]|uniref:hypothetical protein n=1 Tax=Dactylosporangium sp. NPDC051484 TaxID=3154942 RepID=UPI00344C0176
MSGISSLPICDHGRCSAILDAVAARDDKISTNMAGLVAEAIEATLGELGIDHTDTNVRATLGRHLVRLGAAAPGRVG